MKPESIVEKAKRKASEIIGRIMSGTDTESDQIAFSLVMPYLYQDHKYADQARGGV